MVDYIASAARDDCLRDAEATAHTTLVNYGYPLKFHYVYIHVVMCSTRGCGLRMHACPRNSCATEIEKLIFCKRRWCVFVRWLRTSRCSCEGVCLCTTYLFVAARNYLYRAVVDHVFAMFRFLFTGQSTLSFY